MMLTCVELSVVPSHVKLAEAPNRPPLTVPIVLLPMLLLLLPKRKGSKTMRTLPKQSKKKPRQKLKQSKKKPRQKLKQRQIDLSL